MLTKNWSVHFQGEKKTCVEAPSQAPDSDYIQEEDKNLQREFFVVVVLLFFL